MYGKKTFTRGLMGKVGLNIASFVYNTENFLEVLQCPVTCSMLFVRF